MNTALGDAPQLIEVSPRDGLQNEDRILSTEAKVELVAALIGAGARRLELTSFVSARAVPQLADADEVVARVAELELDASMIGLVLNPRGAERAATHARIDEINLVVPTTDAFGRANQGVSRDEAFAMVPAAAEIAHAAGKRFSVTLAVAFGCPYEGAVTEGDFTAALDDLLKKAGEGLDELAVADTLGCAVPGQVSSSLEAAAQRTCVPLRAHFHDTRRTGLANVWAAYNAGVRRFDSSAGGLGGCPFAPGAAGNVATEDLAWMFERGAVETGVQVAATADVGRRLCRQLGMPPRSGIGRSGVFPAASRPRRSAAEGPSRTEFLAED